MVSLVLTLLYYLLSDNICLATLEKEEEKRAKENLSEAGREDKVGAYV